MNEQVVTVERRIRATPATVFSFFTDRDRWLSWQGVEAEIDPRPGGVFRMNVRGDGWASGRFVVVEPYERIVFTWGWESGPMPVPPGTSRVEITLRPDGPDHTLLRLVHTGLSPIAIDPHRNAWRHYLERLAIRAEGRDPGPDPIAVKEIRWRLHLRSAPELVWEALTTDHGRASFWAERTVRVGDTIEWHWPNGATWTGPVWVEVKPHRFELDYYGGRTSFTLEPDGAGGTDLELVDLVAANAYLEVLPGWVSVLMALKARVDHGIDLRNHDSTRTWDHGYCDN
jgi:uncharacterized protein YndB with AHSA1/START domain